MDSNDVWARCAKCGAELKQGDKQCAECGPTTKAYERTALVEVGVKIVKAEVKQKRKGFKRPIRQMSSRWEASRDPKLTHGVQKEMSTDQEKDEYHQIVKGAKTGQITHEEHEPLSQHRKRATPTTIPL